MRYITIPYSWLLSGILLLLPYGAFAQQCAGTAAVRQVTLGQKVATSQMFTLSFNVNRTCQPDGSYILSKLTRVKIEYAYKLRKKSDGSIETFHGFREFVIDAYGQNPAVVDDPSVEVMGPVHDFTILDLWVTRVTFDGGKSTNKPNPSTKSPAVSQTKSYSWFCTVTAKNNWRSTTGERGFELGNTYVSTVFTADSDIPPQDKAPTLVTAFRAWLQDQSMVNEDAIGECFWSATVDDARARRAEKKADIIGKANKAYDREWPIQNQ